MMNRWLRMAFSLCVFPLAGCLENNVELGGGTTTTTDSSPQATAWQGYIENYKFLSGSDAIAIHLDSAQGPDATGSVRFGDAPDLPPASDPDVGYPPGLVDEGKPGRVPHEGFDFTIEDGSLADDRLKVSVVGGEVWNTWCSLQTPVLSEGADPPFYGCLPNWYTTDPCEAGGQPVDCAKMELCLFARACNCDASGCEGAGEGRLDFDIRIEGDKAHGSVKGLNAVDVFNVWLTRAEE